MTNKIKIITLLAVLSVIVLSVIIFNSVGVIVTYRGAKFVDDYNEYYLYKKSISRTGWMPGAGFSGYKVWFWPGQKGKLLEKIKEDVNNELKDMVENNNDIFKGYEIRDDFKKITVYYNRELAHRISRWTRELGQETVALKVELFHEFIHGYGKTSFQEYIVEFVEADEFMPTQGND